MPASPVSSMSFPGFEWQRGSRNEGFSSCHVTLRSNKKADVWDSANGTGGKSRKGRAQLRPGSVLGNKSEDTIQSSKIQAEWNTRSRSPLSVLVSSKSRISWCQVISLSYFVKLCHSNEYVEAHQLLTYEVSTIIRKFVNISIKLVTQFCELLEIIPKYIFTKRVLLSHNGWVPSTT